MRQATLCYLVKEDDNIIKEVCLALKKRGFGEGRWNGVGGKVKEKENIEEAMLREVKEEVGVDLKMHKKVGELDFYFPHMPENNQKVHVYLSEEWEGELIESEEMRPDWFLKENIDYNIMWSDDIHWLPQVLEGKLVKAEFVFTEGDMVKDKKVEVVENF